MSQTGTVARKPVKLLVSVLLVLMLVVTFAAAAPTSAAPCTWTHTVRPGDTLSLIAHYYGTTVSDLVTLNSISNPNVIFLGTKLCISDTVAPPGPYPNTYTVQVGDTLANLAFRFGAALGDLAVNNNIGNPNVIFTGEILNVPAAH